MFFDDIILGSKKAATLRTPPIPDTGWKPPIEFPNLSQAEVIAFDVETRELDFAHGPGWARGKGHIIGISIAARWSDNRTWRAYMPIEHECERGYNLSKTQVFQWTKASLENNVPKIGTNALYDVGWLTEENIFVSGPIYDIQFAEALLDEEAEVALETLAYKYLGRGKESSALYDWCAQAYGGKPNGSQRANIYRSPPRLAGPYAESDASLPIDILAAQWPLLQEQGLLDLFKMECASIPMLVRMRMSGVRVDLDVVNDLYNELGALIPNQYLELRNLAGGVFIDSVSAASQVARLFDAVGIQYPRTPEGAPSFRKEWLKEQNHPVASKVNEIRETEKIRGTFLRNYILEGHVNGRLYCQFHPLRNDENGAKTGRYSSSDPNLQNIPSRTELGRRIRRVFIADIGHLCWEKGDHSQIEYRMLANFAVGEGSQTLRQTYNADPRTDYHDRVFKAYCSQVGLDYANMPKDEKKRRRTPLKNINFGLIYGQTEKSLAYKAGMSQDDARSFFKTYHEAAPYVKPTMAYIADEVQHMGFITTILGRRVRFPRWEPDGYGKRGVPALPYEAALAAYGSSIKRAGDYKGTNYKFQGSAADCMKVGMLKAFQDGVFDVIGMPKMQVHDELNFSVIDDSPLQNEAYEYLYHECMEQGPQGLKIPLFFDHGRGPNWGAIQ